MDKSSLRKTTQVFLSEEPPSWTRITVPRGSLDLSREPLFAFGLTFVSYLLFSMGAGFHLSFFSVSRSAQTWEVSPSWRVFVCFVLSAEVRDKESGGHLCVPHQRQFSPTISSIRFFPANNQMAIFFLDRHFSPVKKSLIKSKGSPPNLCVGQLHCSHHHEGECAPVGDTGS